MSACPKCMYFGSLVTVTRKLVNGWVKRYRRCDCGHRWTTYEIPAEGVKVSCDDKELMKEIK